MTRDEIKMLSPGDYVVANKLSPYAITRAGSVCKFIGFIDCFYYFDEDNEIYSSFDEIPDEYKASSFLLVELNGYRYNVHPEFFDFTVKENVESISDDEVFLILNEISK